MRWLALVVAMCLVSAACSPGETPEQSGSAVDAAETSASPAVSTTTLRPPPPTDPPELGPLTIGDLEVPCAPSPAIAVPPRPGITAEAITIGTGTDRGGIATGGAGSGVVEMIEALADLCNGQGGLLGRVVRVEDYDAAAVEGLDRAAEACTEVAALVGAVFLQSVEIGLAAASCGLASLPAGADLVPTVPMALHGHFAALFLAPETAAGVVLVGPDTPSAEAARTDRQAAIDLSGAPFTVIGSVAYPVDEAADWSRIVGDARATGAGQVHLVGGCDYAVVPFVEAAAAAGWKPIVVTTADAYDPACLAVATPENLLVEVPFLPFEDGDAAPATQVHGELLDQVGAPRTGNGLLAASAFWRWATAAETCLPDEDRGCVDSFTDRQEEWTAGGLHQSIGIDGASNGCALVLAVEAGAFVRRVPSEPGSYDCTPEWSVTIP